jgi:hypothetical protein
MITNAARKVWRLDRDGRLIPRAGKVDRRVVAADQGRIDPDADYLFCAPDFLFPADGVARALRLELDSRPAATRNPPSPARARGARWGAAMKRNT